MDYESVTVNNELIWSTGQDLSDIYFSSAGVDSLHFDADPGVYGVDDPLSRTGTFSPQVATNFGTARGLILGAGDDFVEHDSIVSYKEETEAGYKTFFYKIRFRMFVSTFGEIVTISDPINYVTENGKTVTGTYIPTTRLQNLLFTISISTALTDAYPADTRFRVASVELGPRPGDDTHIVSSEIPSGGVQDILFDTYADDLSKPLDKPVMTAYDNILINDDMLGTSEYLTDGTFTVGLMIASGAIFDEDTNSWYLRDVGIYFDFDIGFEFVVNEYSDARWRGSLIDMIIAYIPARLDVGMFAYDPLGAMIPIILIVVVLVVSLGTAFYFIKRKVVRGKEATRVMAGI
jgi:hypothetical protein